MFFSVMVNVVYVVFPSIDCFESAKYIKKILLLFYALLIIRHLNMDKTVQVHMMKR